MFTGELSPSAGLRPALELIVSRASEVEYGLLTVETQNFFGNLFVRQGKTIVLAELTNTGESGAYAVQRILSERAGQYQFMIVPGWSPDPGTELLNIELERLLSETAPPDITGWQTAKRDEISIKSQSFESRVGADIEILPPGSVGPDPLLDPIAELFTVPESDPVLKALPGVSPPPLPRPLIEPNIEWELASSDQPKESKPEADKTSTDDEEEENPWRLVDLPPVQASLPPIKKPPPILVDELKESGWRLVPPSSQTEAFHPEERDARDAAHNTVTPPAPLPEPTPAKTSGKTSSKDSSEVYSEKSAEHLQSGAREEPSEISSAAPIRSEKKPAAPRAHSDHSAKTWPIIFLVLGGVVVLISLYTYFKEKNTDTLADGIHLRRVGKYKQAIEKFDRLVKENPNNADIFVNRGLTYALAQDFPNAVHDYDSALALNPKDGDAWLGLSMVEAKTGDFDRAISDSSKALDLDPNSAHAYYVRGLVSYKKGDYEQAASDLDHSIRLAPHENSIEAWGTIALSYLKLGRPADALVAYDAAIKGEPGNDALIWGRALAYGALGNYSKAIEDADKHLLNAKQDGAAYVKRASWYEQVGELAAAANDYAKAVECGIDSAQPKRDELLEKLRSAPPKQTPRATPQVPQVQQQEAPQAQPQDAPQTTPQDAPNESPQQTQ